MEIQHWEAKVIFQEKLILGEGPHWYSALNKLLYVDIESKKLCLSDPVSGEKQEYQAGSKIGSAIPVNQHQVIVALQGSLAIFDLHYKTVNHLVDLEKYKPENRSNDGKCDAMGRLWFGTMQEEARKNEGALYCYDGRLTKMIDRISVSNGICWSSDHGVMYYIDSFDKHIKAFDFDINVPALSNSRIVVEIKEEGCLPDGMCIDEKGMLWVAIWGGGCVNRYNPESGNLIGKVSVNAPHVTSCAFGGEQLTELFITTATKELSSETLINYPESGAVFSVETGIKGAKTNTFNSRYI
ncbi:SMP-30/gluconolactonase/LRE family protein [Pedobacter sp. PAMC26386]|nr:SMP-30/gluconolactonase/LRE family protein [Pedobacter sp. PAMC26386]